MDEARAIRETLTARFDFDLAVIIADARELEKLLGGRLVDLRAKRDRESKQKAA